MTVCKFCVFCECVRYDGGNRSKFRPKDVDDYIYYCHRHGKPVPNENATCKDATKA